jgi:hypothetical protein
VSAPYLAHLVRVFVIVRQRRIHLAQRDIELVRDVNWRVSPLSHELVDVKNADAGPLDSRVAAENALGSDDFSHCCEIVRVPV